MTQLTHTQSADNARSTADLVIWWNSLTDDEQDLLHNNSETVTEDDHLMQFLAWTECPLVIAPEHPGLALQLRDNNQLLNFLSQETARR